MRSGGAIGQILSAILRRMPRLDAELRRVLNRLEHEAAQWREEPIHRVIVRNKLVRPRRLRQFHHFGEGAVVERPLWLYGAPHISIGARSLIIRPWMGAERQVWGKSEPSLVIGEDVTARYGCTISCAESLVIEDHCSIGAFATIIDSRHTWNIGNPNPMHNPIESAPVRVGRGTWVADRATIAAGADIGEQCAIGPNTLVTGKVADYSVVLGNPGRVVGSTRA